MPDIPDIPAGVKGRAVQHKEGYKIYWDLRQSQKNQYTNWLTLREFEKYTKEVLPSSKEF